MPVQGGCPMAGYLLVHDHSSINQGGILNPFSFYGAYREANGATSTVNIANDPERVKLWGGGAEIVKRTRLTAITGGLQQGSFRFYYDVHNTLGVGYPIDIWLERNGSTLNYWTTDSATYVNHTYTWTGTLYTADVITLSISAPDTGNDAYARNLRIYFGWRISYFGNGTSRVLSTPLALTDTDNPITYVADDP